VGQCIFRTFGISLAWKAWSFVLLFQ
jgi:hypothetical protein